MKRIKLDWDRLLPHKGKQEMMRKSGGFFSKLTSNHQKAGRKACLRPDTLDKLSLEKVLGLTTTNRNGLACNPVTGVIAYPAGCVIVLYDPKTNGQNHIFNPEKKTITCVNFSSDGKYLVSGESGQQPLVRVWELNETLTQVAELKGHKSGIACVEFSPNQKLLVSIGDQHDMLVNVWNWKLCQTVACNKSGCRVRALSFSEDGSYLVTVGNRHVKFWYMDCDSSSIKANAPTIPINGRSGILGDQKNNVFTDVMCGRGICSKYTYCVTKSGLLCVFNEKRIMEKWVELETGSTNCLVVTENLIICGCSNGLIHVLDPLSLKFMAYLPRPHPLGVNVSDAITPSDLLVPSQNQTCPDLVALCLDKERYMLTSVYNDHSIYIWDVHDVKKVGKVASFLYHSACIWGVEMYPYYEDSAQSFLPYGSFLTCSADDTIRIWNLAKGSSKRYPRNLYSKELLKTVYIDAALANLQDLSMVPSKKESDVRNGIRCMQISPNGQVIATGDRTGNLRIYDMEFFDELYRIEAHESEILCVEFSCPDSGFSLLASSSRDRLIHIFDVLKSYELLQTIDDHSSSITAVRFNYDIDMLQLLSCGADKVVMFHNAQVNDYGEVSFIRNTIVPGKATLYDMGVEPTRKLVATVGQDRNLRIYDIQQAKQLQCYKGSLSEEGNLIKLQFDGGGIYAAISCSDKTIGIYEFGSGECEATAYGHSELVTGLKFSADGRNLISVSGDGCIFVWGLPYQFSENIRHRMRELNLPVPPDDHPNDNMKESDSRRDTFMVHSSASKPEEQFVSSENWSSEIGTPRAFLAGYRFSVGQLPVWAQKQMRPGDAGGTVKGSPQPLGRWRERTTEGLTTVPEFIATGRMSYEGSVASSNGSEKGCGSPGVMVVQDAFDSQIIYPGEDSQINECNRTFQVTQASHLKKEGQSNDSVEQDCLNDHRSGELPLNSNELKERLLRIMKAVEYKREYSNADNPSDCEPASDCLSVSPDGSDQESDSAEGSSPLMEHFEQLGTPNKIDTYSTSSAENGSSSDGRLCRSTSISARFLSKSQLRPSRKISTGSLCQSPEEQKRKLEAVRGARLKKNKLVSRSCQNLSSFASPSEFEARSINSEFNQRNNTTPVYHNKLGKQDNKQKRRTTDLNNWTLNSDGMRVQRSDSINTEQFPVKIPNKKVSPQVGRRGSVDTCALKNTSNGTSGVTMRKTRSKGTRPKSMTVQTAANSDFGKQMKNICNSDEENENLFSKMRHAFKPSKRNQHTYKHSSQSHSQSSKSPSHVTYKKTTVHANTQHKSPTHTQLNIKKQTPQMPSQSKQSPTHRHTQVKQSPSDQNHELDSEIEVIDTNSYMVEDMDTNSYLADQNADRLLGVVNEIDNVIHTRSIQTASTNLTPHNMEDIDNNIVINMIKNDSYLNCNQRQISRTPPERDVPIKRNAGHKYDTTTSLEEVDMEQSSLIESEHISGMQCSSIEEEISTGIEALRNQSPGVLSSLINSYNKTVEFQTKVLCQPESDVQRRLLGMISRTYLSIETSISEQRKLIDRNIETSSETRLVIESDGFKELARVISPRNSPLQDKNKIDMIAVLDKYSNLLLDVVTSKKNRETLIE